MECDGRDERNGLSEDCDELTPPVTETVSAGLATDVVAVAGSAEGIGLD